jgi:hypothetical protein
MLKNGAICIEPPKKLAVSIIKTVPECRLNWKVETYRSRSKNVLFAESAKILHPTSTKRNRMELKIFLIIALP